MTPFKNYPDEPMEYTSAEKVQAAIWVDKLTRIELEVRETCHKHYNMADHPGARKYQAGALLMAVQDIHMACMIIDGQSNGDLPAPDVVNMTLSEFNDDMRK